MKSIKFEVQIAIITKGISNVCGLRAGIFQLCRGVVMPTTHINNRYDAF